MEKFFTGNNFMKGSKVHGSRVQDIMITDSPTKNCRMGNEEQCVVRNESAAYNSYSTGIFYNFNPQVLNRWRHVSWEIIS